MTDFTFAIADNVRQLGVRGAYFIVRGLQNKPNSLEFEEFKQRQLAEIISNLSRESIDTSPTLNGFHQLHCQIGRVDPKDAASPKTLLNFLLARGELPKINLIVDIYNLVSVETQIALGAHDLNKIDGNVHLRLTNGLEKFWPLGSNKPKKVSAGDYAYIDDSNDVLCWLEVRQVEKTKVTLETTDCFFIVQGNCNTNDHDIQKAKTDLIDLLTKFCGFSELISL